MSDGLSVSFGSLGQRALTPHEIALRSHLIDRKILFVGGSKAWFHQIEHDLHYLQPTWQCELATDVMQAQKLLKPRSHDVLVVDGKIQGGHGIDGNCGPPKRRACIGHPL